MSVGLSYACHLLLLTKYIFGKPPEMIKGKGCFFPHSDGDKGDPDIYHQCLGCGLTDVTRRSNDDLLNCRVQHVNSCSPMIQVECQTYLSLNDYPQNDGT